MLVKIWPTYLCHREQWAQIIPGLGAPLPKLLKCPKERQMGRLQSQVSFNEKRTNSDTSLG